MNKRLRYILLACILFLLACCAIISISYGFYTFSIEQTHEISSMTNVPACAGLQITDNKTITLDGDYAVPLKDSQVLNSSQEDLEHFKYSFKVTNDCSKTATMSLGIAPFSDSNISLKSLKYVIVEEGASLPNTGLVFDMENIGSVSAEVNELLKSTTGKTGNYVYNFLDITLGPNSSKSYNLYIWIDYDEGDLNTMGKTFSASLILNNFDTLLYNSLASYVVKEVYETQQNNSDPNNGDGIYYHDGNGSYTNANLEAGDESYRYSGTNPNNFVCFGSDASICPDDNLYRIIGVFNGNVKLIKWDYASSTLLGTNGAYHRLYSQHTESGLNVTSRYKGSSLSTIGSYYRKSDVGYLNDWETSDLNTINLNTNFLNNIGEYWSSLISDYNWKIGGGAPEYIEFAPTANAKVAFDNEIGDNSQNNIQSAKVGLMYVSDYYYSATPVYWSRASLAIADHSYNGNYGSNYDYRGAVNYNWLYMGLYDWTISLVSTSHDYAYNNNYTGFVGGDGDTLGTYSFAVRPTFYLKPSVIYASGSGTRTSPFRIASLNSSDLSS